MGANDFLGSVTRTKTDSLEQRKEEILARIHEQRQRLQNQADFDTAEPAAVLTDAVSGKSIVQELSVEDRPRAPRTVPLFSADGSLIPPDVASAKRRRGFFAKLKTSPNYPRSCTMKLLTNKKVLYGLAGMSAALILASRSSKKPVVKAAPTVVKFKSASQRRPTSGVWRLLPVLLRTYLSFKRF